MHLGPRTAGGREAVPESTQRRDDAQRHVSGREDAHTLRHAVRHTTPAPCTTHAVAGSRGRGTPALLLRCTNVFLGIA